MAQGWGPVVPAGTREALGGLLTWAGPTRPSAATGSPCLTERWPASPPATSPPTPASLPLAAVLLLQNGQNGKKGASVFRVGPTFEGLAAGFHGWWRSTDEDLRWPNGEEKLKVWFRGTAL